MESIDKNMKKQYMEALDLEPCLVRDESPKIAFLRTDNFDPQAAALRLARYWKYRKEVFGSRWLLPLNQTGRGALTADDIAILRSCYLLAGTIPGVGSFAVQDHSRLPVWNQCIERLNFYWTHIFNSEEAQTNGVRLVNIVSSKPNPVISIQSKSWKIYLESLPMKFKDIIVVQSYEEGKQELIDYKAYQTQQLLRFTSGHEVSLLAEGNTQANLRTLETYGVNRNLLPCILGGTYDYNNFNEFIRKQITIEDIMSPCPPILNASIWRMTTEPIATLLSTSRPRQTKNYQS